MKARRLKVDLAEDNPTLEKKKKSVKTDMSRPRKVALIAFIAAVVAAVVAADTTTSLSFKLGQVNSIFADLGTSGRKKK